MAENERIMSIWDHLDELRRRLIWAVAGLIVGVVISLVFTEAVINLMAVPINGLGALQAIEMTETLGIYMKVALLGGFIVSLPHTLLQILLFVVPGLTRNEKRWLFTAIPFATLLFMAGVAFTYFVMLPAAVPFLVEFLNVNTQPTIKNYINFVTNLMFWIGVCFEIPLIVFVLAKFKIVSAGLLAKQWRFAVIIIAVLAAFVTPTTDPVNMALLMLPLFVLYILSILMAAIAQKPQRKKRNKE